MTSDIGKALEDAELTSMLLSMKTASYEGSEETKGNDRHRSVTVFPLPEDFTALQALMHLPIEDATAVLGISVQDLISICCRNGVIQWPSNSIQAHLQEIEVIKKKMKRSSARNRVKYGLRIQELEEAIFLLKGNKFQTENTTEKENKDSKTKTSGDVKTREYPVQDQRDFLESLVTDQPLIPTAEKPPHTCNSTMRRRPLTYSAAAETFSGVPFAMESKQFRIPSPRPLEEGTMLTLHRLRPLMPQEESVPAHLVRPLIDADIIHSYKIVLPPINFCRHLVDYSHQAAAAAAAAAEKAARIMQYQIPKRSSDINKDADAGGGFLRLPSLPPLPPLPIDFSELPIPLKRTRVA